MAGTALPGLMAAVLTAEMAMAVAVIKRVCFLAVMLAVSGCVRVPVHIPVPEQISDHAVVDGYTADIRSWADEPQPGLASVIEKRVDQYRAAHAAYYTKHQEYPPMNYLALSGGAYDGAFAAGILYGWTKTGKRPDFAIVTGTSTGALIAPFAFLGPKYDDLLRQEYTTLKSENVFLGGIGTVLHGLAGGMALVDTSPLKARIDKEITPELFAEIAAEHRKGRHLLIGTTNLEAQRGVIWDIGVIANSGNPGAIDLFKKILLASSAVPGLFSPVFFDITAEGHHYQEIHVDGGVASQVFLYPLKSTRMDKEAFVKNHIQRNLYIIRNGKVFPEYKEMKPILFYLSERSVETLIKNQGIGDLYRIYAGAMRDSMNYRLVFIPPYFKQESKEIFDPDYMRALFDLGFTLSQKGDYWLKAPPGIEYSD
jgi:predicted acylesterase/phospholipase RssA